MELTFSELKKRDVINLADGRCLGRITDIKLSFPDGRLIGIIVPGRRVRRFLCFFDKTEMYIDERKIVKIGGDVILVDVKCESSSGEKRPPSHCPPPCPPPCPPSCPPPCPPHFPPHCNQQNSNNYSSEYYTSQQMKGESDEY